MRDSYVSKVYHLQQLLKSMKIQNEVLCGKVSMNLIIVYIKISHFRIAFH